MNKTDEILQKQEYYSNLFELKDQLHDIKKIIPDDLRQMDELCYKVLVMIKKEKVSLSVVESLLAQFSILIENYKNEKIVKDYYDLCVEMIGDAIIINGTEE